jgi:pimeloyl-ACP methyl ester carboxylesterase
MQDVWDNDAFAPFDGLRAMGGCLGKKMIIKSIDRRFELDDMDLKVAFAQYIHQVGMRKKSSEQSISFLCGSFLYPINPLETTLKGINIPTCWLYGQHDWMERSYPDAMIAEGTVTGKVFSVSKSCHHLYIENSEECVADILSFTHSE